MWTPLMIGHPKILQLPILVVRFLNPGLGPGYKGWGLFLAVGLGSSVDNRFYLSTCTVDADSAFTIELPYFLLIHNGVTSFLGWLPKGSVTLIPCHPYLG